MSGQMLELGGLGGQKQFQGGSTLVQQDRGKKECQIKVVQKSLGWLEGNGLEFHTTETLVQAGVIFTCQFPISLPHRLCALTHWRRGKVNPFEVFLLWHVYQEILGGTAHQPLLQIYILSTTVKYSFISTKASSSLPTFSNPSPFFIPSSHHQIGNPSPSGCSESYNPNLFFLISLKKYDKMEDISPQSCILIRPQMKLSVIYHSFGNVFQIQIITDSGQMGCKRE